MRKYPIELKREVIDYYFKSGEGYHRTAIHFDLPNEVTVLHWIRRYKELGEASLYRNEKQSYTPEYKEKVIKYMRKHKLSYVETAIHFNLGSNTTIKDWDDRYKEKGLEGLAERKQHDKKKKKKKKTTKRKKKATASAKK